MAETDGGGDSFLKMDSSEKQEAGSGEYSGEDKDVNEQVAVETQSGKSNGQRGETEAAHFSAIDVAAPPTSDSNAATKG